MGAPALRLVRDAGLECAYADVPPALSPYVHSWVGYSERTRDVCIRRELPISTIVVIIEFGPPLLVYESGSETRWARYQGGFVAGLTERFTLTEHGGYQAGIELRLTPMGARVIFGIPLGALAETVVQLTDLLPRSQSSLSARLASCRDWPSRFAIVQALLETRMGSARAPCKKTRWAVAQIQAAHGSLEVGALARELGCSRKHLAALFHDGVGFTPKAYAGIVRFERLVEHVKVDQSLGWAEAAVRFGYADQAHLAREVKRYSGLTPRELARSFR
ncbi:MAG TPA: AraC family transcriptional regulator [Polyangiaceae bacterium]|nr:AraC family transcriptional regulator [Polyangiaceae bacterium]